VATKDRLEQSSSSYAQGGIAGVLDPEDRFEDHIADTLRAGGNLCDPEIVAMVVREAPERIRELIAWGTQFDESAGELLLGREGGHSHHRIVHAMGDATGREVMRAVVHWTERFPNVQLWKQAFTIDLIVAENACRGAIIWNPRHGKMIVWAKQTILCTGGAGQIYRESTNPTVSTGDGMAIAYRAGAELRDMEFMQFHPTVLYIAGSSRSLITEAMRGEGAYLVDVHGHRFMPDYDSRAELAPRDIVAQAIVTQMQTTQHPNVYLDVSHLPAEKILARFPGIASTCRQFGIDITSDRIPVRPGAHYMIGGVTVDAAGRTKLPGLWAAGEVTSSGLHGANRLASNSLLEGLVFGAHAGRGASQAAREIADDFRVPDLSHPSIDTPAEPLDVADIRNSLTSMMWRSAGVRRDRQGLLAARNAIQTWCRYVLSRQFNSPPGWELQNMLIVARLMILAALEREESRGVHLRTDFPQVDEPHWNRHLCWTVNSSE
jgi:L-aspartate oxidase